MITIIRYSVAITIRPIATGVTVCLSVCHTRAPGNANDSYRQKEMLFPRDLISCDDTKSPIQQTGLGASCDFLSLTKLDSRRPISKR